MAAAGNRLRIVVRRAAERSTVAAGLIRILLRVRDRVRPLIGTPGATTSSARPLAPYATSFPQRSDRLVVVLADADRPDGLRPWLEEFGSDAVHVFVPAVNAGNAAAPAARRGTTTHRADTLDDAHEVVKTLGPADVILDLRSGPEVDRRAAWLRLFLHLRNGGSYVIGQTDADRVGFDEATRRWVSTVLDAEDAQTAPRPSFQAVEYAAATASVTVSREVVLIQKRLTHLLKLRDAETNSVLPKRDPALRMTELETLPEGAFDSGARVTMYEAGTAVEPMPGRIRHPALHLRRFEGRIAFRGATLLHTEHSILPESFRWHLARNPSNPLTVNSSPAFARLLSDKAPRRTLNGRYYMVDPQYGGYGHVMTEMVGRLWGWDQAKAQFPELKALFSVKRIKDTRPEPKHRILRAYGIPEEDIVWLDEPVYLTSLISPTSMWHNHAPYYVHPQLTAVWDRLREALIDRTAPTYERIFISRTQQYARRTCRNAAEVERVFAERGFEIIYPERLDLSVQVGIFAAARTIAGFGGSGLFNMMFAQNLQTTIVLNHDSYQHRNEHLYTSLLGGAVHYFWSPADIPQPERGTSLVATESDWEFDFARHGAALKKILDEL